MSDEVERLNRVLDDLAAERDLADRADLCAEEVVLAQTAAFLKAAAPGSGDPDPRFVERLSARLGAMQDAQAGETYAAHEAQPGPMPVTTNPDHGAPEAERRGGGISRRRLFGRVAAAAAGAAVGVGAGEVVRGRSDTAAAATAYEQGKWEGYRQATSAPFSVPLAPHDRGKWFATGHNAAAITPGQATRFRVGAIEGFLVNPGNGKPILALSAACTHMGCLLSWMEGAGTFLCPCHGAQYQADGAVLSGIARHPLPRLQVRVEHDGEISVWSVAAQPPNTTLVPYEAP